MMTYKIKKIRVKLRNFGKSIGVVDKTVRLTKRQKKIISILKKVINNPNSEMMVDPVYYSCYVQYKNYFIKLTKTSILIRSPNSEWYAEIDISVGEKLVDQFYNKVSERRITLENSFETNSIIRLNKILIDLKN